MIGPSRSADVPPAPSLASADAEQARDEAASFFGRPAAERSQERFAFTAGVYGAADVHEALLRLFEGKCAYCESRFSSARPLKVDHFRPVSGALALDGAFSPDHYWWLAYEWENLLPACPTCIRMKGSRFPVAGQRAEAPAAGPELALEEPLLLDPRVDPTEEHLVFADGGDVVSKTERGRVTIECLGLNRRELVERRRVQLRRAREEWDSVAKGRKVESDELARLYDTSRQYAAMRRQFLTTWASEQDAALVEQVAETEQLVPEVTKAEQRDVKQSYDRWRATQESYSVASSAQAERYFVRTRLIERVTVRNLRAICDLEVDVPPGRTDRAPWMMLLGENGTGKSTVLQAAVLALMGDRRRAELGLDPAHLLRSGTRRGSVEVLLTGVEEPIRLEITRRGFKSSDSEPKVLLLGYGATRLLPRPGMESKPLTEDFARVENMFDPFSPLRDATQWLLDLPPKTFDPVARALKGILMFEEGARLRRNRRAGRIEVESYGDRVPLEYLSDGYQSVLALAVDVMSVMLHRWEVMEVAEGIVVIDELGAHIHPRWRMRIVLALRDVFPRVQFLASTHDPLCLRGLSDGEVVLLRRTPEGAVHRVADLPSIEGVRVDQILTSEFFGLNSTIDPELDRQFTRYYQLKGKWKPTAGDRTELEELSQALEGRQVLGRTRRERLLLEAADDYLAAETRAVDDGDRDRLKDETKKRLADLWAETEPLEAPPL